MTPPPNPHRSGRAYVARRCCSHTHLLENGERLNRVTSQTDSHGRLGSYGETVHFLGRVSSVARRSHNKLYPEKIELTPVTGLVSRAAWHTSRSSVVIPQRPRDRHLHPRVPPRYRL